MDDHNASEALEEVTPGGSPRGHEADRTHTLSCALLWSDGLGAWVETGRVRTVLALCCEARRPRS